MLKLQQVRVHLMFRNPHLENVCGCLDGWIKPPE
uniref:Uncharacterized protein n=1 Tax=Rubinisphaera brasiliensis (strain ATCC 49424 / DSM 5305 / JCM 21570 / IAM 15109 / NBRC 103401 / IFAM 1448) TaxID=756272 RepID=F0SSJ2_RUBBR|nr:hypothetical protein Plabr_2708 [Rubinisphaera brasiliensis DSM 5305]